MTPQTRVPGKTYAQQGIALPTRRAATRLPPTTLGPAPDSTPPSRRVNWLGPRFEPGNISATAKISDIQTAIRGAENGDPTSLFRFYRDELLGDEHIQGEFNKRKLAILGERMTILPQDDDNEDDIAAAAACTRIQADCENWNDGMSALLDSSAIWPVSILENVFRPADPKPVAFTVAAGGTKSRRELVLQYTLKRMEPVNPMLFCYLHAYLVGGVGLGTATPVQQAGVMKQAQDQNAPQRVGTSPWYSIDLSDWEPFLRLWPIDEAGRIIYDASRASKLDPDRHIVHRGHLLTQMRDNWGGPGRAISFWWLLRLLGRDWFGRFMERYGSPYPVAKTNVQDPDAVNLLTTAFSLATKIGGLVIGQDDSVDLQQAMVQGGAEGHKLWCDVCNDGISFPITGYKSAQRPGGINAGEETQQENIRGDIRIFDEARLAETLVKQLFARALKFNGLAGAVRIVWGGLSTDDASAFAMVIKTMSDSGFEPTDESMPTVEERTGLQWQRKATPDPSAFPGITPAPTGGAGKSAMQNETGDKDDSDDENLETMSAKDRLGRLIYFSAGGEPRRKPLPDPIDPVVSARIAALSDAYRGAMAPFRQAILSANSRGDAIVNLKRAYSDWSPARLNAELEHALQICAAAGAAKSVGK